jgi:hypothetical protein
MMATDGPAALRLMLDKLIPINLNAEWDKVDKLVSVWQAEREQAAADRAEIANCLENIRELAAQKRTSDAVIADVREELHIGPGISVVEEAGRVYAALAQARALLKKHAVRFGALGMKCAECGMVLPGHDEACKIAALEGGADGPAQSEQTAERRQEANDGY